MTSMGRVKTARAIFAQTAGWKAPPSFASRAKRRPLTGPAYDRVATLVQGNCALYSNHLPLDAHPRIGNNVLLARQLGLKPARSFLPNEVP